MVVWWVEPAASSVAVADTWPFADLDRGLALADTGSWGRIGGSGLGMRGMWGRLAEEVGAGHTSAAQELQRGCPPAGTELTDSRGCWWVVEAAVEAGAASLGHPLEAAHEVAEVQSHRNLVVAAFSKEDLG